MPLTTVTHLLRERSFSVAQLAEAAELDDRVAQAVAEGRYTPSPQQRQRIAQALGVDAAAIVWGHVIPVDHMYGHGPQFGRSP